MAVYNPSVFSQDFTPLRVAHAPLGVGQLFVSVSTDTTAKVWQYEYTEA